MVISIIMNCANEKILEKKQLIIKEQIVPGQFGFSDIYIRHLFLDNELVISYTNYELTDSKKK